MESFVELRERLYVMTTEKENEITFPFPSYFCVLFFETLVSETFSKYNKFWMII